MIDRYVFESFLDELEKHSSAASVAAGAALGGAGAYYGRQALQDLEEGKSMRKTREFQKQQQLLALNRGFNPGGGF